jgi:hypothetical protein
MSLKKPTKYLFLPLQPRRQATLAAAEVSRTTTTRLRLKTGGMETGTAGEDGTAAGVALAAVPEDDLVAAAEAEAEAGAAGDTDAIMKQQHTLFSPL